LMVILGDKDRYSKQRCVQLASVTRCVVVRESSVRLVPSSTYDEKC